MNHDNILTQLNALLDEIERMLRKLEESFNKTEAKNWIAAAAFRVWSGNGLCAEEYVSAMAAFYQKEITVAQVTTALDCVRADHRAMRIPKFFDDLVMADSQEGTSHSRDIADRICRLLADLALVNGDFTLEEAGQLRKINELLLDHRDRKMAQELCLRNSLT